MNKVVIFAFRGDPMCFVHVLLNALDLADKGMEGSVVIEGDAVKLVPEMGKPGHFLHQLYASAREKGLILGACKACSTKLGAAEAVQAEGVELIGTMSGHPAVAEYIAKGYTVLTM
ncbi:MAG: cytoplasmic protein [Desulfobulbus sp.]|nr:MAG: cytoplasmic protein [Desulfobulbus sp.]